MCKLVLRALCVVLSLSALFLAGHRCNLSLIVSLARAAQAPPAIELVTVWPQLESPVYVTNAHDGSNRLFIIEQPGRIRVFLPGIVGPATPDFLDIRDRILSGGERGLLGLAFHPQFATNQRVFVNYTRRGDGATVISEFKVPTAGANAADRNSEKIILIIPQPYPNHNGGMIEFGPDGYLYIGMGDGGSANDPENRAQNNEELLGKILRIDVDHPNGDVPYSSPSSNPFFGATPGRDEIYATGLRNPWRFSFDRQTGQLYAGDVGQNVVEEVDIITRGGNYGWRVFEGTRCTNLGPAPCTASNYIAPLVEYNHTGGRCSVTGGYVYRGARGTLPAGSYIFGDYCTGEIFLWQNNAMPLLRDTNYLLSSFGEDEAGELYLTHIGIANQNNGALVRIVAPNATPSVSAANYRGGTLAVESIAAAFIPNFAQGTATAPDGQPLPTTLANVTVQVRDANGTNRPAPLFFVSPTQINFQIPPGTAPGNATITYLYNNSAIAANTVNIANIAPGLFSADASGKGIAAALVVRLLLNGSQVFEPVARFDQAQNRYVPIPIDLGPVEQPIYLALFGTGFRFRSALNAVTATVGGTPVEVTFAGPQGTFTGLDQANLLLPRTLVGRGEVDVILTVDGQQTNAVRVAIK